MEKIRAIIVDDEELARKRIVSLLKSETDVEVIGECDSGSSAVAAILGKRPDLVFLDVQMPAPDGFAVLQKVGVDRVPVVLFVTAYDRYALRAFESNALDYLLKPFNRERFQAALHRVRQQLRQIQTGELNAQLLSLLKETHPKYLDRLVIRSGGRVLFRLTEEVNWFEADSNYVRLHFGKQSHIIRDSLNRLEAELDPDRFVRVHRSAIVRIDFIEEMLSNSSGGHVLILRDGLSVKLGREYRDKFKQIVGAPR
ncbi:MAG: LytTR family DNA-binding domain-containing protein [Acidobacteriaceae bacterium]